MCREFVLINVLVDTVILMITTLMIVYIGKITHVQALARPNRNHASGEKQTRCLSRYLERSVLQIWSGSLPNTLTVAAIDTAVPCITLTPNPQR